MSIKRTVLWLLLAVLLVAAVWLSNLIWFKPFNIRHFYDRVFVEIALDNPEVTTQLGIPVLYDLSKDELTDESPEAQQAEYDKAKRDLETLLSYDTAALSEENQLNSRIMEVLLRQTADNERFQFHDYPVNQMFGVQNDLPSMMVSSHKLEDSSDVDAYITRLMLFGKKFDQVLNGLQLREQKGVIPPAFVIQRVLNEMRGFYGEGDAATAHENVLYTNLVEKLADNDAFSDSERETYAAETEAAMLQGVFPAYKALIEYFEALQSKADDKDGVWKLPDGEAYYASLLKQYTTTDMSAEEIHNVGLSEVARISNEMWAILEAEGRSREEGTLGEVIQSLNKDPRFLYSNDDSGREQAIARYKEIISDIEAMLDGAFAIRPKAGIDVQRVPEFREEGSAGAYYYPPAMDGSRGGVFFANLRDMSETVQFGMKTLAYHEGVPGHHFQIAIQMELEDVPIMRTMPTFTAFVEGWALYSEQLAWELGVYENDPMGNLGRLQAEMFRAVRLVVDTGLHQKRWTRQEAIDYMVANTGMTTGEVTTEIERYIVMPGQATAYKIGMLKILELREKAKTELGERFNLRDFHDVVLINGALPLGVLAHLVDQYIAEKKA